MAVRSCVRHPRVTTPELIFLAMMPLCELANLGEGFASRFSHEQLTLLTEFHFSHDSTHCRPCTNSHALSVDCWQPHYIPDFVPPCINALAGSPSVALTSITENLGLRPQRIV